MPKQQDITLSDQDNTRIYYQYRYLYNAWFVATWTNSVMDLNIYNYRGGELKVLPHTVRIDEDTGVTKFLIYLNGELLADLDADDSGRAEFFIPSPKCNDTIHTMPAKPPEDLGESSIGKRQ
ncbi:MAG: conserved hypothetical protein [Methanobrevibacter sp. CfCl-M3]